MNEDEIARNLTKIDQLLNQLIFAFIQTGMSYRQAEEELFRRLKRKRFIKKTQNDRGRLNTRMEDRFKGICA